MTRKFFRLFSIIILSIAVGSCGNSEKFTIEGKMTDGKDITLRYIYYDAEQGMQSGIIATREGKFDIKGALSKATVIEITDNNFIPVAKIFVEPGDKIKVTITPGQPMLTVQKGNETGERWSEWQNKNAKLTPSEINGNIAGYLAANPEDAVSALLLLCDYAPSLNPEEYKSLKSSLSEKTLIPSLEAAMSDIASANDSIASGEKVVNVFYIDENDSVRTFRPSAKPLNLMVFSLGYPKTEGYGALEDSISTLRKLRKKPEMAVMEFFTGEDNIVWGSYVRSDTVDWERGWLPVGTASPGVERLMIRTFPYYILSDSSGKQLYRGPSSGSLAAKLDSLAKRNSK